MKKITVVAAIIEGEDQRVLLAQRPPGKTLAGFWEFPGGKIEAGESSEEALARELQEELGLNVEVREDLGRFSHAYDWGLVELHVFVVRALNSPRASADVHVFKWLEPSSIALNELAAADHEPLKIYLRKRDQGRNQE